MQGVLLGFAAALGYGTTTVLVRIGLQYMRSSSAVVVSLLVGAISVMLLAVVLNLDDILNLPFTAFLWFALVGLLHFGMARSLSFMSVSLVGAAKTAAILASSPFFAFIFAVTLGGETLRLPVILGAASISIGLILIVSRR